MAWRNNRLVQLAVHKKQQAEADVRVLRSTGTTCGRGVLILVFWSSVQAAAAAKAASSSASADLKSS